MRDNWLQGYLDACRIIKDSIGRRSEASLRGDGKDQLDDLWREIVALEKMAITTESISPAEQALPN